MQEESIALPLRGLGWALAVIAPAVLWYFIFGYKLPVGGIGVFFGEFWGGVVGLPSILAIVFALIKMGGSPVRLATSYAGGVLTPIFAAAAWTYTVNQPGFSMV